MTPPHITEFMAQLAEVNKDSVVYDNCTGTGGFLVSAMQQMILDTKGDQAKIKHIKQKQLVGVEYQAHVFALACSNMFIHQDGKTNILNGSCFDPAIMEQVKKFRPTVGLLNPPYKGDKKTDTDEFEFILSNLECLEQGGRCVAIVPMQQALATDGKIYEYKKKIMKNHTLEAVFSMPNELFHNSKTSVVTCIMVFTAKRPHPKNKEVYFGYYKEDGFVKRKTKGRVDLFGEFENHIRDEWIVHFINHTTQIGLSVNKIVIPSDEWSAESYMETDYSVLESLGFEQKIRDYLAYKIISDNSITTLSYPDIKKIKPNLEQLVPLKEIFDIRQGKSLELINCEEIFNGIPFISRTSKNNGIAAWVELRNDVAPMPGDAITVALSGSVLSSFYQEKPFYTAFHIACLYPKQKLTLLEMLYYCAIIEKNQYRYNFGRQANKTLKDIRVPILQHQKEK